MNVELTPDNEQFLTHEIAAGMFADRSAAINTAVSLLKERKSLLARLDKGRRQLDSGEYVELQSGGAAEYVEEVHQRGLERRRRAKGGP